MERADKISSLKNPLVKALRALKDREARLEQGRFLVEGPVMLREALSCGLRPQLVGQVESTSTSERPLPSA